MSGGGGGGDTTTVQKADPWSGVQPYLKSQYALTNAALQNPLDYYPGQTYAGFSPLQEAGMFGGMNYAQNYMFPATLGYQSSLANYMDAPLNISQDPAVQAMMSANRQQVTDQFTRDVLPAISGGAIAAGQLGGSRQGIAQGLAAGEASKALAQANAQTMLGALDPMTRLAGYASNAFPGALQLGMYPAELAQQYGAQYQGMDQNAINEAMARYYYPEQSLWDALGRSSNIYAGAGQYGSSTTTAEQPGSSPVAGALGGAMALAPLGLPFALGGALLGGLFS